MKKFSTNLFALFVAGLLLGTGCTRQTETPKNSLPESFIPAGYEVMKQAEGDLNSDGRADVALALKHKSEPDEVAEESDAPRRLLVVLFGKTGGGYEQSFSNANMILGVGSGGVFGDPFQELRIEDGRLAIIHYGGSSQRWGIENYLRFRGDNWLVIKQIETTEDLRDGTSTETIKDYERGENIKKTTDAAGETTEKKSALSVRPWPIFATSTIDWPR
ncbi:MAG: hypothetical protein HYV42_01430 [Candidatus Magasanikbacteria bacterium]|nr:hypothetical protein [Candidatus Magasanikbacteria bacterium]